MRQVDCVIHLMIRETKSGSEGKGRLMWYDMVLEVLLYNRIQPVRHRIEWEVDGSERDRK